MAKSGVKRRGVAEGLVIPYSYLNQLEYGRAVFTRNVKAKFAAYFNMPVEELFPIAER